MCLAMIAHHGDEKFAKLIEGLAESLEGRLEERKAFWRSSRRAPTTSSCSCCPARTPSS